MGEQTITRRGLLARGAALAGVLVLPSACGGGSSSTSTTTGTAGAGDRLAVFRLNVRDAKCNGKTCSCSACAKHAENKVFATSDAANLLRAHRHCNCAVAQAGTLPRKTWIELFGDPDNPTRDNVDRRRPGIADKLRELRA